MTVDGLITIPNTRYIAASGDEVRILVDARIGEVLDGQELPDAIWYWVDGIPFILPLQTTPAEFAAWAGGVL